MAAMQFWGVEVKAKEPNKVTLDEGHVIHLSQATLSELKKDNEPVTLHVTVGEKKFVLGILNQTTPQLSFDLIFDEEFEISHNWKNGSVHLLGYETELPDENDEDMFEDDSEDEEEALPTLQRENGKSASAPVEAPKLKATVKPAKDDKPKPQEKDDTDEDDSDDEDEDGSDDDDSVEDMMNTSDDSDDDEDDSEDEDAEDEKPAKLESGKKRANSDAKTPETKKAKLVTPHKSDGKKGAHTATPHPSKKGAKTPGSDKSTPKSGGQFGCEPCNKSFNSENALQSHKKAKHGGK